MSESSGEVEPEGGVRKSMDSNNEQPRSKLRGILKQRELMI